MDFRLPSKRIANNQYDVGQQRFSRFVAVGMGIVLLVFACAALVFATEGRTEDWSDRLDPILIEAIESGAIPGAAVVVVRNGEFEFVSGYGHATIGGQPVGENSRFSLASVSKSFVGLAVTMLAAEGVVDLDEPISNYLPDVAPAAPTNASPLTVRHLLNHTSGFSRYQGNVNQDDQNQDPMSLRAAARWLGQQALTSEPGTRFEYSNANYQVLGALIEELSGSPFDEAMQQLIFDPIGMRNTQIGQPYELPSAAQGYRFLLTWLTPWSTRLGSALMPQGGISTSASDMGRYLIALTGGNGEVPNVWDPALANTHDLDAPNNGYAAGWFVREGATTVLFHHGLNPGFGAVAAFSPESRQGIAVLINASNGFVAGDHNRILDSAVAQVFPDTRVESMDYTVAWVQLALLWSIIVGILVWIIIFFRHLSMHPPNEKCGRFYTRLVLPSIGLAMLGYLTGWWLPQQLGIPVAGIIMFSPDIGWTLFAASWLALLWAGGRFVSLLLSRTRRVVRPRRSL